MTSAGHWSGGGGRGGDLTVRRTTDPAAGETDVVVELGEQEGR